MILSGRLQDPYTGTSVPLNHMPVDAGANRQKGDADAATLLPPDTSYRCRYVVRQVAVKAKYGLWMTAAESAAIRRLLARCRAQRLPRESGAPLRYIEAGSATGRTWTATATTKGCE